ncbi:type II secretory protein PulK [Bradyrhizobium macuxiense]|uniref:Type II secretory protein PulK n=1 Tax=Bradyrhizobium macuxiense TaxID=1755647 RepID=A0A109J7X1_9BRAD|nr:type II secretion system protein GspK [Bradyrhizobium macuxiense]KWV43974.1 type II secretory protein PulK [Bradyrhizobium macuxiense]
MAASCATARGAESQRGFIVIAVLWILAAVTALVLIYLTYVINTAIVVASSTDRIQAEAMVSAGLELAALQLSGYSEAARPSSGTFNARVGAGRVFVSFRSEAARIDLNAASKQLLSGLMAGLGASPFDAAVYADRILAWRTPTGLGDSDPETSFYKTSGLAYAPRHAPFPAAEELGLVYGIPSALVERMLPFVTVFSNMAQVNILDAEPQVLAALPGMTPIMLQAVVSQRSDPALDPHALIGMVGGEGATIASSKAYRVVVDTELPDGRRRSSEIVILLLEAGDEPYCVLSWRNNSDGSTVSQRAALR